MNNEKIYHDDISIPPSYQPQFKILQFWVYKLFLFIK